MDHIFMNASVMLHHKLNIDIILVRLYHRNVLMPSNRLIALNS